MMIVTTPTVPGKRIVRALGIARGSTVRSRHLGRDLLAAFRNIVGGEVHEYTKLLAESREHALDRMVEEARSLGANGVVGMRFGTSEVANNAAEILAYGTAVVLEENGDENGAGSATPEPPVHSSE
jgi:uncharacterized protein YbjQ (UPF0145 family)